MTKKKRFKLWEKKYGYDVAKDMEMLEDSKPGVYYAIERNGMKQGWMIALSGAALGLVLGEIICPLAKELIKKN